MNTKSTIDSDFDALLRVKEEFPNAQIVEAENYNFTGDYRFYVDDFVVWVLPDGEIIEE